MRVPYNTALHPLPVVPVSSGVLMNETAPPPSVLPMTVYDTVSPSFQHTIEQGLQSFSAPWLKRLAKEGYECRVTSFLSRALPPGHQPLPSGQASGVTYDHLQGLHIDNAAARHHMVIVAEKYRPLTQTMLGYLWPSKFDWARTTSPVTVLHHELGHAAAQVAGLMQDRACQKAYQDDVAHLPPRLKNHPAMQQPSETMGCITASLLGQGGLVTIPSSQLLAAWPSLAPAVARQLNATLGMDRVG